MPNNEGMRRQPLPEEEGGAKLFFFCRDMSWSYSYVSQEAGNKNRIILTKGRNASCHQRADPTRRNLKEFLIFCVTGQLCNTMQWEYLFCYCFRSYVSVVSNGIQLLSQVSN